MIAAETPQQTATLTIDQKLQQAITHHQVGELQDAEHLYRTILQTQPNHPDVNYNLGVLTVQMQQPAASLPYFEAALKANPGSNQYWLSYIDALIHADLTDLARQVLAMARQFGLQGDAIEALMIRLEEGTKVAEKQNKESLPISSAAAQNDKENPKLRPTGPNKSTGKFASQKRENPSPKEIDTLVTLLTEGRYIEAETLAQALTMRSPEHGFGWMALGMVFVQIGRSADALILLQKAAALSPNDAEAHNNLSVILRKLGRLDEAEVCLQRALEIKSDYVDAHHNLGNTLADLGRLAEAAASYRQALQIKPDCAKALCDLGHTLCYLDDLEQAAIAYQKVLDIDSADCGLDAAVALAVLYYLNENPEQCRNKLLRSQPVMAKTAFEQKYSRNYWLYIDKLLSWHQQSNLKDRQTHGMETLYVIGESHSLSAHGMNVRYNEQEMQCIAEWISGCKQWHLGNDMANKYKYKFEAVMGRLPRDSTILLTIGEIDCRHDEGIIKAWKKCPAKELAEVMQSTVVAYLGYVAATRNHYGHRIIVGGVPATNIPLDLLAATEVEQLVHLIRIFNAALKEQALAAGMDFLDVYTLTDRGDGIANGEWYIDNSHLLPSAVVAAFDRHCLRSEAI
jgi:tetratricopeptide (TPR) repeat protein